MTLEYQPATDIPPPRWSMKRFLIGIGIGVLVSLILTALLKLARLEKDTDVTLLAIIRLGSDLIAKVFLGGTIVAQNPKFIDFGLGVVVTLLFANACIFSVLWGLLAR